MFYNLSDTTPISDITEEPDYGDISEAIDDNQLQNEFQTETDAQINLAISELQYIEGLDSYTWQFLDADARLMVLQNVESQMAEIQNRPSVKIISQDLENLTFGGYDGECIRINANHLESDMPVDEFVNTIIHEGRHAFQEFAINTPGVISDQSILDLWADNILPENYLTAEEYGQELYISQPIEADAWNYADRISSALYPGYR